MGSPQACGTLLGVSCEPAVCRLVPQYHHSLQCLKISLMIELAQNLKKQTYTHELNYIRLPMPKVEEALCSISLVRNLSWPGVKHLVNLKVTCGDNS